MKNDECLLKDFLNGDKNALEHLIQRYENSLYNFIYRILGSTEKSEEIFQETFLRVFRFAHTFNFQQKFKTWLYSIALHLCRDEIRKNKNKPTFHPLPTTKENEILLHLPQDEPTGYVYQKELEDIVEHALNHLSPKHREVLILHHYQNLKYEEIAQILNRKIGTIKSQIYYATQELKKYLEEKLQLHPQTNLPKISKN